MEGETNLGASDAVEKGDDASTTRGGEANSKILQEANAFLVFQDESTDCAICLGSLNDPDREVIKLTTCGHRWHLDCLKDQLEQAQPNPAQRLVLTGCRCAKCNSVCEHPELRHMTRKTDTLREKIDVLLKEQLDDAQKHDPAALEEARRKFAVYLCSHCSEPYFGGTIACADTAEGEVPPEERLCVACAPARLQQAHCRYPLEHRGHHIWKCRYCCNVATYVCYGTVHFCQACHDRAAASHESPSCRTAISCKGGDTCPFPKPQGIFHHRNGKTADCEQVYSCACCQSNPTTDHAFVEPSGSRNLLQNACGQNGLESWQQMSRVAQWQVEQSDIPVGNNFTTNFVSTFQWCIMGQVIPLHRHARDPSQVRLEASAKYMSRTDCASVFRLEVILLNDQRRPVARQQTDQLAAPADFWERTSLLFEPTAGAHEALFIVHGKDVPFWRGHYGSKVTDCQIRVLGSPEELEQIMIQEAEHPAHQHRQRHWLSRIGVIALPVMCMVIWAWLLQ